MKNINFAPVKSVRLPKCGSHVMPPPAGIIYYIALIKMYAIVEIAGQQFKVEKDSKLFVHHLPEKNEGDVVEFDKVLLVDNGSGAVTIGAPTVSGAKVAAKVITPLVKGEKVIVFKKRRRKGYQTKNGHRQQFTEIVIENIIG